MTVFVTGGGLLGYWVVKELISKGENVLLYDIKHSQLVQENIPGMTFIQGDILDYPRLVEIFHEYGSGVDGIIHTAAITSYYFLDNPYHNVNVNIVGTMNILEIARVFKVAKVIYTSSGAVYGNAERPSEETAINPMNLYAASKVSGELLGLRYATHWGIDFRCARLYFLYGPPSMPSSYPMIVKILFGPLEGLDNLRLESGADHQVDFTYVKDGAKGIVLLYQAQNLKNRIFNITGGQPYKLSEVVEIVKKYSHPTQIELGPGCAPFPMSSMIGISLAKEELGFEPEYTLERGVSEYAEWLKEAKRSG